MANTYFDRYDSFSNDEYFKPVPGIDIPVSTTDKYVVYKKGVTRLDRISNDYYGNGYSSWLIMLANKSIGSIEYDIPDNTLIRVPFPYSVAINAYIVGVQKFNQLYNLD